MASEYHPVIMHLRDEYLKYEDVNVIMLDWKTIAGTQNYIDSARATQDVGKVLAQFVDYMVENMNADTGRIHIIGQSLGGHISGFAGKYVTKGRIARISGLDPAGPLFLLRERNMRLDSEDAEFVDVIHTAAGTFGHYANLGHVDFYPNGGVMQPNCVISTIVERGECVLDVPHVQHVC